MDRRWLTRLVCGSLFWGVSPMLAGADLIHFSHGRVLEGIVIREDASEITVRVAWEGHVVLDRASIAAVERGTAEDHRRMLAQWQQEFLSAQQREQERLAFEAAQMAKGLIQYQGRWVTEEELEANKAKLAEAGRHRREEEEQMKREREARQQREKEVQALTQRLQVLQAEHQQLEQELAHQRAWFARIRFIAEPCAPHLLAEEQRSRWFLSTSDGRRVDVQVHGDHLAFTDDRGIHYDFQHIGQD